MQASQKEVIKLHIHYNQTHIIHLVQSSLCFCGTEQIRDPDGWRHSYAGIYILRTFCDAAVVLKCSVPIYTQSMFQLFRVQCFPRLCLWSEIQLPGTGWDSFREYPQKPKLLGVHPLRFCGHWAWKQLVGLTWIPESPKPTERKNQIPVADGSAYSFHLFSLHARRGYIING